MAIEPIRNDADHKAALARIPAGVTPGVTKRQVRLLDVMGTYKGPDIFLDFDANDELIGLEILDD